MIHSAVYLKACFFLSWMMSVSHADNSESCTDPRTAKVSCTFESGFCAWINSPEDSHDWRIDRANSLWPNEYASASMRSKPANTTARLESPWLCATGDDSYSLSFRYYLYYSDTCRLSVFLRTATGTITVWSEHRGELKTSFKELPSPLTLRFPSCPFQIIFEGTKLTERDCGNSYNEIDIDTIQFKKLSGGISSSSTICPSTSSTLPSSQTNFATDSPTERATLEESSGTARTSTGAISSTESSTNVPAHAHNEAVKGTNDTGLSGGAVAGVVIGILLLVILIAVLVFIWRKHTNGRTLFKGKENSESGGTVVSHAVFNSLYSPSEAHAHGPFHLSNTENSNQIPQEQRNQAESENYYSIASEPYYTTSSTTTTTTGPKQDVNGYELVNPQRASTNQSTVQGVTTTTSRDGAQACKGNTATEDDYNKLSLQPARAANPATGDAGQDRVYDSRTGPDTYNELAFGCEPSEVPESVAAEYSHVQDSKRP